jgi:hypothetical protein
MQHPAMQSLKTWERLSGSSSRGCARCLAPAASHQQKTAFCPSCHRERECQQVQELVPVQQGQGQRRRLVSRLLRTAPVRCSQGVSPGYRSLTLSFKPRQPARQALVAIAATAVAVLAQQSLRTTVVKSVAASLAWRPCCRFGVGLPRRRLG